ncbi:MAG: hypothetical protein QOH88_810 [Verrucomicrobiota bacterium]|jgi:microcystin-dependent protein
MSSPFVAEIRIFGCNFAPTGWAQCNGQLLPLSQNTALFSLLGTFYGGDGKSTFALPNIQGCVPIHVGGNQPGKGLSEYFLGQVGGASNITLLQSEMAAHNHLAGAQNLPLGSVVSPTGNTLDRPASGNLFTATSSPLVNMAAQGIAPAGSSLPHNNMMPFLVLNFCIALQGVFPPRT